MQDIHIALQVRDIIGQKCIQAYTYIRTVEIVFFCPIDFTA